MKQILVKLFLSLKQAIISLFKKKKGSGRVEIDSNHDGKTDITIEFFKCGQDEDDQKGD
jgi:hypothetical protein